MAGDFIFDVLAMMLVLCLGLPFVVFNDITTVISGMTFFLISVLLVLESSSSMHIIYFKPI